MRPFLTRKGDDDFNWPTSRARKGDAGFSQGSPCASKGDKGFRQPGHLADRARLRRPRALKPCPAPPFHTWSLSLARGPDDLHAGDAAQTHVEGLMCVSRG